VVPSPKALSAVVELYTILLDRYRNESRLRTRAGRAARRQSEEVSELLKEAEEYAKVTAETWQRLREGRAVNEKTFPLLVSQ
jgi:hypothetical protein